MNSQIINRILLGVNIDHVATLRQARGTSYPDPAKAALDAEEAGADSITLHLREDRRHIIDSDVGKMRSLIQTPMNLEIALNEAMVSLAAKLQPNHVCFVPERREELTTEGGLDVLKHTAQLTDTVQQLKEKNVEVSVFIDPDCQQIEAALACGVPAIELHTGHYSESHDPKTLQQEIVRLKKALEFGLKHHLVVNAGHGLNYTNVEPIAAMTGLNTLNIGHAIIARAIFVGIKQAVVDMKQLLRDAMLNRG